MYSVGWPRLRQITRHAMWSPWFHRIDIRGVELSGCFKPLGYTMLQKIRHQDVKNERQTAGQNLSAILNFKPRTRKNGGIVDYKNPSINSCKASELRRFNFLEISFKRASAVIS